MSARKFIVKKDAEGRVLEFGVTDQETLDHMLAADPDTMECPFLIDNIEKYYVSNGVVARRPIQTIVFSDVSTYANLQAAVVISGIPENGIVRLEGREYVVTDGRVELVFAEAGDYEVTVDAPPCGVIREVIHVAD